MSVVISCPDRLRPDLRCHWVLQHRRHALLLVARLCMLHDLRLPWVHLLYPRDHVRAVGRMVPVRRPRRTPPSHRFRTRSYPWSEAHGCLEVGLISRLLPAG